MRKPTLRHRFSFWDGSQRLPIDPDEILAAIADDLMEYGDLKWAMRNLMSRGMKMPNGGYRQGLRDMLRKLREQKKERLDRYDLGGVMKDIKRQLDEVLAMERERIDEWLNKKDADGAEQQPNFSDDLMKGIAKRAKEALDKLPPDPAGQVKALEKHEFINPDAQRKFLELLNQLRRAMTQTFFNDIERMVKEMSAGDIERMKDMLKALNDMLVKRIAGDDPGFEDFMAKFGDMFGDDPPQSLDDLLERMRQQMAATQSLLASMSPDQRAQLQSLMSDKFGDPELESELRKLAKEMEYLNPDGNRYKFGGNEELDLEAAMRLMSEMHELDDMIDQVQDADRQGDLDSIDADQLEKLLGEDAKDSLDDLKKLLDALENAGYIRPNGDNYEMTPRGSRMIGQKALGEIYARLRRQSLGNHAIPEEGRFGERLEQTKPYEFGDPFHLHMPRTIAQRDGSRRSRHAGQTEAGGLRGLPLRADHVERHRDARRPVVVDGVARFVPGREKSGARAAQPDHVAVSEGHVLHHRFRRVREGTEARRPAVPAVGRIRARHEHAARAAARREVARETQLRHQTDHHDFRRRTHRAPRERPGAVRVSADARDDSRDDARRAFVHAEEHRDQYVHARRQLLPEGVHGPDRENQRRPRVLHDAGEARGVHPRRLRAAQAQAAGATGVTPSAFRTPVQNNV